MRAATLYEVTYGDTITATAKPSWYFKFSHWSDGVTTATRTDLVTDDMDLTAIFVPIDYEITIKKTDGGIVEHLNLNEKFVNDATFVLNIYAHKNNLYAIPDEGYRFVSWSDGSTEQDRAIYVRDIRTIVDEENKMTLYAIFEKIE